MWGDGFDRDEEHKRIPNRFSSFEILFHLHPRPVSARPEFPRRTEHRFLIHGRRRDGPELFDCPDNMILAEKHRGRLRSSDSDKYLNRATRELMAADRRKPFCI